MHSTILQRLSVAAALVPAVLAAQQQQPPPTTLRAQARLVVVDVVVLDKDHHPVHSLKKQDFTLAEGNTPQTLNLFEEHSARTAAEAAKFPAIPPMPPGVFTNYTPAPTNSAVNVLLLDSLNTPLQDQAYVRQQLLAYVKNARPESSTAIFGLSTRLVMLQGFTSNPEVLKAIVMHQGSGKASVLLDDAVGGAGMPDTVADQNIMSGSMMPAEVAANLQTFENITQSFQLKLRAQYTLDGISLLARYLSSIPGRKNLIWFSGSFPINVDPDVTGESSDPFAGMESSEDEYRETANLLARSQVAVYPIDARGLMTQPMFNASSSGAKYAANPRAMNRDLQTFSSNTANEHSTMYRMAEDTGGHAFVNTNGLTQAVESAMEEGSNYYTLAYTPTDTNWKGEYRKIQVKLAQSGYQLAYRHGYFADDPNAPRGTRPVAAPVPAGMVNSGNPAAPAGAATAPPAPFAPDPLLTQKAMIHGAPGPTQIIYKVRILPLGTDTEDKPAPGNVVDQPGYAPARPPFRRFSVDFAAAAQDVRLTTTPDGKRHAAIQFVTLIYTPDGQLVNTAINYIRGTVNPDHYASIARTGIPMHQEVSIPAKGDFSIRTGIIDLNSGHIGAAEVPVAAVRNLPSLPLPEAAAPAASTPAAEPSTPSTPAPPKH